ncbi:hypothetical protein EDF73_11639 [Raoultella sp. BIGb0138]|uniref:hypothetical protein n=1 Tax=Raoultella sp. BIGb0138 TaxID=2485115 RepID=UPI00104C1D51|nr:hypothetical protein [Raoultella sp. BIGb0138]TCW05595.1 hypothetical protein EDF73_11639 [Raoultella sp. BIGb0138]
MATGKANEIAFDEDRKESFIKRLKSLVGSRSVRAAAKDWGLSFSTLNNYLSRGTEPSFSAMQAIASKEHVTLDWLAFGVDSNLNHSGGANSSNAVHADPIKSTWNMIFDTLGPEEQKEVLDYCLKEGARSMVGLIASIAEADRTLMGLSLDEKERLLRLNEQLKKGSSESDQGIAKTDLTETTKKAG